MVGFANGAYDVYSSYWNSSGVFLAWNYKETPFVQNAGIGGGGGGLIAGVSPYSLDGDNGAAGCVWIMYEVPSTFRVPVQWGYSQQPSITIEEGLPVVQNFDNVTAWPNSISFSVSSGSLPNGLSLNTTTGVLSGTPSSPNQSYNFTISASNGYSSVSYSYSGTVSAFSLGSIVGAYSDTTSGGFRTIVWRGAGSISVNSGGKEIEVLVVGGGGAGGFDAGGGGGGGRVLYSSTKILPPGNNTIIVGAGGSAATVAGNDGTSGGFSRLATSYWTMYANGGGRGGRWGNNNGAYSGGGGGSWGGFGSSASSYSEGDSLYGFNMNYGRSGGRAAPYYDIPGDLGYYFAMGGGGGASTAGGDGITYQMSTTEVGRGGNGGTGLTYFGTVYGDGGGGGSDPGPSFPRAQALGGSGNGGKGQSTAGTANMNAVAHTGSGGGGSSNSGFGTMVAGNGSSGIVIVRFAV